MKITNKIICNKNEVESLKKYLIENSYVSAPITLINRGARVCKGIIEKTDDVGLIKTCWSELGRIKSIERFNQNNFLVKQVVPILKESNCKDENDKLGDILACKKKYSKNQLELVITLLKINGLIIADGNTRVVACYEYNFERKENITNLPIYLISEV